MPTPISAPISAPLSTHEPAPVLATGWASFFPSLRRSAAVLVLLQMLASRYPASAQPAAASVRPSVPPSVPGQASDPTESGVQYRPPVVGPVVDGWRPPPGPYGAGNRGLDFATTAGDPIGATANGVVSFAGSVAGNRWVVIRHADGRRSSLGPLGSITVSTGALVVAGQTIGTAATTAVHWGVREADVYVDPGTLLPVPGSAKGRLRLTG